MIIETGDLPHIEIKVTDTKALPLMGREQNTKSTVPRSQLDGDSVRVLVVSGQNTGGIWHYACLLSSALRKSGVNVALATMFPFERVKGMGEVPIWPVGTQPARTSSLPVEVFRHVFGHADKLRRLGQLIVKYRPRVVHLQDRLGQIDFLYLKLLKRMGIRIVITAHDARRLNGRTSWVDRARNREADAIFVHSVSGVRELIADGVSAAKIRQIRHPNYLDFCVDNGLSRDEARHLLGISPRARSILFFGTITPYKGLDILLRAFSIVTEKDPRAHLTIAGEPLEDFAPYKIMVERFGLADRVLADLRYIPFAEFPKYFRSTDVVVMPYRRIYQSGILQLAYGFERPVIVTNVGGLGEAVAEDHTGVIVNADDPKELAAAIQQILTDRDEAGAMGKRGRRLAETKYSWSTLAGEVGKVYQSISYPTDQMAP